MGRKHLVPLLMWSLLWALFFATLLLGAERLPTSDLSGQFHAFGLFQAREISAGDMPTWSPGSYGGVPFAADTQAAVFYPLRLLTILFTLPTGFTFYALELEGLLHIWLSGLFAYMLAFEISRERWRESEDGKGSRRLNFAGMAPAHWAGLIAAVAFGLGGYLTSYPLLQLAVLETVTWLPLVLFLLRRGVRPEETASTGHLTQIRALLASGIILGVSALAGHPQTFLHVAYLAAVYYLFLAWQARWRWTWIVGLGMMVTAVALGVAMASFLPAIRFLPQTVRNDVSYDFVAKGFPLLHTIQFLLPGPLSLWLPQYSGIVTIFLLVIAWFGRHQWQERLQHLETYFWFSVVLIAAWLSLGDKGILFELAFKIAPGFSLFRQQERLVSLVSLGLALLAAQGIVLWLQADTERRRAWLRSAMIVLAAGLLLVGFILLLSRTATGQDDWISLWGRQWLIIAIIAAIAWPRKGDPNQKRDQWRSLALLLLLFFDLFLSLRGAMDLQQELPSVFWPEPAWLQTLTNEEIARVDAQNLFHTNLGEVYNLQDIKGISPLKPQFTEDFEELPRPLRWQLLNVKHVLAEQPIEEGLIQVASIKESVLPGEEAKAFVYRFEDALPRAWMVYEPIHSGTPDEALDTVKQADFDPARQVVLTNATEIDLDSVISPSQAPHVETEKLPGSGLLISVETETAGILVLSEWAFPGWKATIDGIEVPLLAADYALQGLYVPSGTHEIRLLYVSPDVTLGLSVLLLTLAITAVVAWRWQPVIPERSPRDLKKRETPTLPVGAHLKLQKRLSPSISLWIMVAVVLSAFGLRVFLLGNQELRGDEAFSYLFAQLPMSAVIPELIDQGDPHPPFHYLLLNGWVDLTGVSEFAMRFLSLLPGLLLVPVLFQLGREMTGRRLGILAATLATISPSLIWLAQDVRNQYTLAILFTTLATWLLVILAKETSGRSRQRTAVLWVVYAVLCALSIYSHYYAVFALLAHGLYLWFVPQRWRFLLPWMACGIAALLLFLPWLTTALSELLEAGQLSDPDTPDLARYLVRVGTELIVGASWTGRWIRWVFLGMMALVMTGFLALCNRKPGWAAMLAGWFGGAVLIIFLVRFSRSTFNAFYISVAAPAWILLLVAGAGSLWQRGRWGRGLAIIWFSVLILVSMGSLRNYYFDPTYSRTLGYREVGAFLQAGAQNGDVFIAHFPDPSLDYYLREVDIKSRLFPARTGLSTLEVEQALARLAEENERMWLVPYHHSVWDAENVVPRWLASHSLIEQELKLNRLTLASYRPLHVAEEVFERVGLVAGDEMLLDGAYVKKDGRAVNGDRPISLGAGSKLQVTLLWSAVQKIPQSYTVFVHILDDSGMLLTQHDGIPLEGSRPTFSWQEGEQILDTHELVVPEGTQGSGRVVIGVYDTETFERQLFTDGRDEVKIADVEFD